MPPSGTDEARPNSGPSAPDPFAPDGRKRSAIAKSPFSGVPYYVISSNQGMRDKLPRTYVSPSFMQAVAKATADPKIPQWSDQNAVIRFMLSVGAREVEKILEDPSIDRIFNQFSALSLLETVEAGREASRKVLERAQRVMNDPRATQYEMEVAKMAVEEAIESTEDPSYKAQMRMLLEGPSWREN